MNTLTHIPKYSCHFRAPKRTNKTYRRAEPSDLTPGRRLRPGAPAASRAEPRSAGDGVEATSTSIHRLGENVD